MELIRDIFIAVMFAMCILLIVVVSNFPDQNPLKRILTALSYRIGATLLAGVVAVPIEPIPGIDVLYDLAVPIALIWYWLTFFRDAVRSPTTASPPSFHQKRIGALHSRPSLEVKGQGARNGGP